MMLARCLWSVLLVASASAVVAQGVLFGYDDRVHLPFVLKQHLVNVSIRDGVAETTIEQLFANATNSELQAEYWFPVPEGAAISHFSLTVGDRAVEARLLPREEARRIYEGIVRRKRDPALLEFAERNLLHARVFPIPPNGERRIRLRYVETLRREGDMNRYLLPVRATRSVGTLVHYMRVRVEVNSSLPLTNIFCPSHPETTIKREGANSAIAEWSAEFIRPERDLLVCYSASADPIDLRMLTYRTVGDGYFVMLLAPNRKQAPPKIPKRILFVFDRTGSMAGDKIKQAKEALAYCVRNLQPYDHFNLILFNEHPRKLFDALVPATRENVERAAREAEAMTPQGGTNIAEALKEALRSFSGDEPNVLRAVVFLTDGLPTVGETDPQRILNMVSELNPGRRTRFFSFGVGYDVNVNLLDKLCQQNRGISSYVRPEENLEARVSYFFNQVNGPLLADLRFFCEGVEAYDIYPRELPDLFENDQIVVAGRYKGSGQGAVGIEAMSRARSERLRHVVSFPDRSESMDFIPRLWATRKIGYLLDEVRLHRNQEVIDEIVRLSKQYGIITELTSFLIDEDMIMADAEAVRTRMQGAASAYRAGDGGAAVVGRSLEAQRLQRLGQVHGLSAPPTLSLQGVADRQAQEQLGYIAAAPGVASRAQQVVRNVGTRTFYQQGAQWVDSRYQSGQRTIAIQAFSDAYFEVLRRRPELRQYLSIGEEVVVQLDKVALQISAQGKTSLTDEERRLIALR